MSDGSRKLVVFSDPDCPYCKQLENTLATVQNVTVCKGFYWDQNEGTRAFASRYQAAHPQKAKPNDMHAGMYASTLHLMKALAQTKSGADGVKLIDAMKAIPTDDPLFGKGSIRGVGGTRARPAHRYLSTYSTRNSSKTTSMSSENPSPSSASSSRKKPWWACRQ